MGGEKVDAGVGTGTRRKNRTQHGCDGSPTHARRAGQIRQRNGAPDGPYRTGGSLIVGAFRCGGERGSDLVDGEVVQRVAVSVGSSSEHVGQPGRFRECRWPGDGEVCVGEDAAAGRAMPAPRVRAVRTAAMAGIS